MKLPFTVSARARVLLMLVASGLAILTCGTHYSVSAWCVTRTNSACTRRACAQWAAFGTGRGTAVQPHGTIVQSAPDSLCLCDVCVFVCVRVAVIRSPELKHKFNCTQVRASGQRLARSSGDGSHSHARATCARVQR